MRLATLAGQYVAVVLSAQIGAQKFIRLPFTHIAIGIPLVLLGRRFLPANSGDIVTA